MNKLTTINSLSSFRRTYEQKKVKSPYIDPGSFFKLQTTFLCLFSLHHLIYNLIVPDSPSLYIASSLSLVTPVVLLGFWKKRKYLAPLFIIVSLGVYNWAHIEFLRAESTATTSEVFLFKSIPMTVANLIAIQNLTQLIHKVVAIVIWIACTMVVTFDNGMVDFLALYFTMLLFVFANFMLLRKRFDGAVNNEQKLMKTVEKLKTLLDMHINDGIVVLDVYIKEILFSNIGFRKIFERKEPNGDVSKNDLKYVLNKILIEEEGARKDEPVYLWELLEALRDNFEKEFYETNCKYQIDTGEDKTFVVKIAQSTWDFTKSFVLVFTDVSQQVVLKELKANEETQDHMLDVFAHELRTPVKNILGALDFLIKEMTKKNEDKNAPSMKYVHICQLSCKYLQSVSNTFLDIARFKHKALKINVAAFSISKLMQEVKEMLECQTTGRGLKFEIEVFPDVPDAIVNDRDKLEQILLNLATNAIKFTLVGTVKIQVKLDNLYPDSIEISVIDTGTGIRKSDREKLFRLFSLLRNKKAVNPDGVGIGLSISQKLARVLAETDDERGIRVDSVVGRGSKFTFSVTTYKNGENCFVDFQPPMLADERTPESVPKSIQKLKTFAKPPRLLQKILTSHQNLDLLAAGNEGFTPSIVQSLNPSSIQDTCFDQADETHLSPVNNPGTCLLVVDDNPVDLMLISQQLDSMNIQYKTAINGEQCLEKVDDSVRNNQPFRGILLDCYMSDLNGFQTAKILKARMGRKELPEIPIFAISAHDNQENREKAYKAGMVAWYSKPMRKEDVQEISDNYLKVRSPLNRKSDSTNPMLLKTYV